MDTVYRVRIALLMLMFYASDSAADDEVLWPQHPIRIDRSKQNFERLPALQRPVDTRRWIRIPDHIKVLDSASFAIDGKSYRLGQIHAIGVKRVCKDMIAGGRWMCGRMAAISLGNLVRGKRLLCDVIPGQKETVLGRCQLGMKDLAGEIVSRGFARADGDARLEAIQDLARAKQAGLWRDPDCAADFDRC